MSKQTWPRVLILMGVIAIIFAFILYWHDKKNGETSSVTYYVLGIGILLVVVGIIWAVFTRQKKNK